MSNWYKDASYVYYPVTGGSGAAKIDFHFPNAATGDLMWSDWLYQYKDGVKIATNITAELLQSYIDKGYDD